MASTKYQDHLKDGIYVSPINGKTFVSLRSFSAHLRNMSTPNSAPRFNEVSCIFCHHLTQNTNIKKHTDNCYLNPINKKSCDVCSTPINNFRTSKTCSYSCANTKFRTGPNNPNWKEDNYQSTCFHYHEKKCIVCDERLIVAVHHLDENHENNVPSNLMPLCPTHHSYWHSAHKHLIEQQVLDYAADWKLKNPAVK